MRILLVSDFYWPSLGGVEQHVRSLAHSLITSGHTVCVATLWQPGLDAEATDGEVQLRRLRSSTQRASWLFTSNERPWAPPVPDPEVMLGLRRVIREHQPDIVHGHDWMIRSFLPLRRWSRRRFGTRFVSSLHYYTLSCSKKNLMQSVRGDAMPDIRPCSGPAPRKCIACAIAHYGPGKGIPTAVGAWVGSRFEQRGADAIIAVSEATARGNGLDLDDPRVAVVPNFLPGRELAEFEPESVGLLAALPSEFILFVGDLRPMKGLDVLLDAYAGLVGAGSQDPMALVLVGKHWPDSPTAFPPGVIVHDRWPNVAVREAWRRSAIAVVPSVWPEPFGIVVIEAMAGGTPVIASAVGGIPEILEDGVQGILVPPGDVTALRSALEFLINDSEARYEMGAAAAHRSSAYAQTAVVPDIERIYRLASCR